MSLSHRGANAYERHRRWVKEYETYYAHGKLPPRPKTKTELEVLKDNLQFIRENDDEENLDSWEEQLSQKWYNKLFREYALVDLKHYKSEQGIKVRWRTEDEVLERIGELTCGSLRCKYHQPHHDNRSDERSQISEHYSRKGGSRHRHESPSPRQLDLASMDEEDEKPLVNVPLTTYQINFTYEEQGEIKQALVKCVLCPRCGKKLSKSYRER